MDWAKNYWRGLNRVAKVGLVAVAAFLAAIVIAGAVRAEGVNRGGSILPVSELAAAAGWTGFGVGAYGAFLDGQVDTPAPVNIGADGNAAGVVASVGARIGAFVIEGFADYGWAFGDLKTIGLDAEMSAGGKACVLVSQTAGICGLVAKSWLDTTAGMIDGWQFGGAIPVKLPGAPLFLEVQYRHGTYDTADLLGSDATMSTVRAVLTYKFGPAGK